MGEHSYEDEQTYDPERQLTSERLAADRPIGGRRVPYLRIFGQQEGCWEVLLHNKQTKIGRSSQCDVQLHDRTVSRVHAIIHRSDGGVLTLEDQKSKAGIWLNGDQIRVQMLEHGDTFQIGGYVLQMRTDKQVEHFGRSVKTMGYAFLPSTMKWRYRSIDCPVTDPFEPGDTLKVGKGGILLPLTTPEEPEKNVLELELTWPNGNRRTFLTEIMGILPTRYGKIICLKIHNVEADRHKEVIENAWRGKWISMQDEDG